MMSLKDKYEKYFRIGTSISTYSMRTHGEKIKEQFNYLTCENAMKYSSVCSEEGIYQFDNADAISDFARKNNIPIHGHTFVWHNQTPDSIFVNNPTREELLECVRLHMKLVGKRYQDITDSWDVVNEAIDDKHGLFLRDSKYLQIIGEDYIDCVFRIAKEVMPDKDLYYNDYNESVPEKQEKILKLVTGMKERGVPIDGVGLQSHHNIYLPDIDTIRRSLEAYANTGLRLRITELDVSMFRFDDHSNPGKPSTEMLKKQAQYYGELFKAYREYSEVIDSVTLWGVCDNQSWLNHFPVRARANWPLLFDKDGQPKEAFYAVMDF